MLERMVPFKKPIYVTRPTLPDINEISAKLQHVWNTKWITNNGLQHQLLENRLRKVLKVPNISLFNNGTIALMIACKSLGISGEVITTPFTFAATPHVLTWNNLIPVFCDVDPKTMNIDANKIEQLITPKTKAILAVHVFGTPCDVTKIHEIAQKYNLKVIYDAAHAFETEINEIGIGNFGDISMFSFHATKLFHTTEGGALTFNNHNLKSKVELLKNFGIKNEEEVTMPGINGKMNEIQACIGLAVLDIVEKERAKRKKILATYKECLKDVEGITFMEDMEGVKNSYQYFVIRIDENLFGKSRDYIYEEFKKYNVFTRKYFYPLCSQYPHYQELSSAARENLPVAHRVANETLSLPFYGDLSVDDIILICNILKQFKE